MAKTLQRRQLDAPPPDWWDRWWPDVLDFFLTIWVLRAPLVTLLAGYLILWFVPQAQDLLVELATPGGWQGWVRIAEFYALVTFVWAMPTHYAARLLINSDSRYVRRVRQRGTKFIRGLQKWSPRVLGALCFVAMAGSAVRSQQNLPDVAIAEYDVGTITWHLVYLALGLAVAGALFWRYTVNRESIADHWLVQRIEGDAGNLVALVRPYVPVLAESQRVTGSNLGPLLLLVMFVAFAFLPLLFPDFFAGIYPRASAVPFVLGGWLPLLALLTGVGRRLQAPLLLFCVILQSILLFIFGDNYRVRLIDPVATLEQLTHQKADINKVTAGINMADAVTMWKRANNCETGVCPRPIIVAAAGGASRAGFFTASVIGQMLDDTLRTGTEGHKLSPREVTNRLFALSTVSGSSVGAVMAVTAMAASNGSTQPCAVKSDPLWSGKTIDSWRSCFETLMAGDFLTPVFTGFTFRDMFRFLGWFTFLGWEDRAALLEQSWEQRFAEIVGQQPAKTPVLDCAGSLECPFLTMRPRQSADGKVNWLPLLVLNGTSVGDGQRIITTPLENSFAVPGGGICPVDPRAGSCPLFSNAPLFHKFLNGPALKDVRLSTAAHNSARFPLISPPGEIRDKDDKIADRIVDGGYFENFGAQTASELASAMRVLDGRLNPFILVLSNDPQLPPKTVMDAARPNYRAEGSVFTDISGPVKAILNTRNARGTLGVDSATAALDAVTRQSCNVASIRVWGEPTRDNDGKARQLSMSWWLSKPIQVYLSEQTEYSGGKPVGKYSQNANSIGYLLDALRAAPASRPAPAKPLQCPQDNG